MRMEHALMAGGLAMIVSLSGSAIESVAAQPLKGGRAEEVFRYDAKGRRDPFVSLVREGRVVTPVASSASPDGTTPILYGIVWDPGGRSLALINDTEVQVGGMIGKYRVEEIRRDAVVLIAGGERTVLQIAFGPSSSSSSGTTTGGEVRE